MNPTGGYEEQDAGEPSPKKRKLRHPRAARACDFCRRYVISVTLTSPEVDLNTAE